VKVLTIVWQQQFRIVEGELVAQEPGSYAAKTYIDTPQDPEARHSAKRGQGWVGYKLQATETDDEDMPHLLSDIAVTSSVETDYEALEAIQERLEERDMLPAEQLGDKGYITEDNLANSVKRGIDLIGPVKKESWAQARNPGSIPLDQFEVDLENLLAVCPAG
jgi:hypothetical protein